MRNPSLLHLKRTTGLLATDPGRPRCGKWGNASGVSGVRRAAWVNRVIFAGV